MSLPALDPAHDPQILAQRQEFGIALHIGHEGEHLRRLCFTGRVVRKVGMSGGLSEGGKFGLEGGTASDRERRT